MFQFLTNNISDVRITHLFSDSLQYVSFLYFVEVKFFLRIIRMIEIVIIFYFKIFHFINSLFNLLIDSNQINIQCRRRAILHILSQRDCSSFYIPILIWINIKKSEVSLSSEDIYCNKSRSLSTCMQGNYNNGNLRSLDVKTLWFYR